MILAVILLFTLIVGLCIGSFLNVVILRTLSNESIVFPPSKCPKCQTPLKWWHNIPILSYVLLKGKCGFCKERISLQYPIIEFITSIAFVLIVIKFGLSIDTLFASIIACLFIILAGTDLKEKVVYDKHTYSLIGIGLIYAIYSTIIPLYKDYSLLGHFDISSDWFVTNPLTVSLLGLIAGFVIMEVISRIGYLTAGDRAFGEGDSFIMAGLGAIYGWRMILPILILSVIIQVTVTLPVYIKKEINNKNWMTLIALSTFSIYAAAFFTASKLNWFSNMIAYIICSTILIILGLLACREILRGVKNPDNRTYLPFGPALLTAGMIFLLV